LNRLAFLLLFSISSVYAASLSEQAQAAWMQRDQPGQLEKAIQLWQDALQAEPQRTELWIPLTKALGRAVRRAPNAKEKKRLAQAALEAGEQATTKNPAQSMGWAYYGEALGQYANTHKGLSSLKKVKQAVKALETSISLDSQNAYAHMLLAEFYRQSPPSISIGDKKKALVYAEKAATLDPNRAINRLAFARALADNQRRQEAIEQLRAILALTPPPDAVPETRSDQETARTLLKEWGAEENPQGTPIGSCDPGDPEAKSCGH
jgi:tetratricopeptide (TPR) repeat protein